MLTMNLMRPLQSALEVEFAWDAVTSLDATPPFTAHMALHVRKSPVLVQYASLVLAVVAMAASQC
jgi:hypothetical protein